MTIRYTSAAEWACDDCHDTGLERDPEAAAIALAEHREDYH